MTGPTDQLETTPQPHGAALPRWLLTALALLGLLVVGLLVVVIVLLTGSEDDSGSEDAAADSERATFDVRGDLTLISADNEGYGGDNCFGGGGYDDILGGSQVVIRDSSSKTIAVGELEEGVKDDGVVTCRFAFAIDDVPSGNAPYSVEVSHRGEISFTEEQSQRLALTLG